MDEKEKILSQVLSLLLVFVLVLGSAPLAQIPVYAAGEMGSEGVLTDLDKIIAYQELAPEIAVQTVPLATEKRFDVWKFRVATLFKWFYNEDRLIHIKWDFLLV